MGLNFQMSYSNFKIPPVESAYYLVLTFNLLKS